MTLAESTAKYPVLMDYITQRNQIAPTHAWCDQLRVDEDNAMRGCMAAVAEDYARAVVDYGKYPYNSAMCEFLDLPIDHNTNRPAHGYYMATCVACYHRLGVAQREAAALIAAGRELLIVAAKSKTDGKPVRFFRFRGLDQIKLAKNGSAELCDGKRRLHLSSSWSVETCTERLTAALRTGKPYGIA